MFPASSFLPFSSFIPALLFLVISCWPEFFTDILFYSFIENNGQDFVTLPSRNLRKTQNKQTLRNFNVVHEGVTVRNILDHLCAKIVPATNH